MEQLNLPNDNTDTQQIHAVCHYELQILKDNPANEKNHIRLGPRHPEVISGTGKADDGGTVGLGCFSLKASMIVIVLGFPLESFTSIISLGCNIPPLALSDNQRTAAFTLPAHIKTFIL